ncbi:transglycosylase domain-containing protein [Pontibacter sp. G13]|uniref:penicillin-binding protein 1A n=1 Tax=Pontibacter sp. G13 TaxID=3074898 RepID=UPI00288A3003|nr:transglycosylase domain-containing protein [Pontibacter sp. G13]WNJ21434.1 transglycosylase domain-containing protein [Pontibacter sp. G13]
MEFKPNVPNLEPGRFSELWKKLMTRKNGVRALKVSLWGIALGLFSVILLYASVRWGAFGPIPTEQELANIRNHNASEVYTSTGVLMGKFYRENRNEVPLDEIPEYLQEALVATEDARFYEHKGVDNRSMARVFFKTILLGDESAGGGSTITQQLAKNLYPRERFSVLTMPVAKIKEITVAKRLERVYSKDELLNLYLNTVSFGEKVFGVDVAAERYFSKEVKDLTIDEAAVLVGMLKANTYYSPRLYPERAMGRRNVVLDLMAKNGYLKKEDAEELKSKPLNLVYTAASKYDGRAPYYRKEVADFLKDYFQENPKSDGTTYNIYTDGLKIYTTLDTRMQSYAELSVKTHMKALQKEFDKHWANRELWKTSDNGIVRAMKQSSRYRRMKNAGRSDSEIQEAFSTPVDMKVWTWEGEVDRNMTPFDSLIHYASFLHAGFFAMDPITGYVKAWVGGINHKIFKYDHVNSKRQVGSTFKPFIYASALEYEVLNPCDFIANRKEVYEEYDDWSPGNSGGNYQGYYSMKGGLTNSVNTVSAKVIDTVGVERAVQFAQNFGFEKDLPEEPSIVLGTTELSLREMVQAYTAFPGRGQWAEPILVLRVEDARGNVIVDFSKTTKRHEVMDEMTADMMVHMMQSVVDSGTARRIRAKYHISGQIAGKTGTTQNQSDGWFMGVTPRLVAGAWVGGEERKVRFRSIGLGQGANTALPIFALWIGNLYKNRSYAKYRNSSFHRIGASALNSMDCENYVLDLPRENSFEDWLEELRIQQEERRIQRELDRQRRQEEREQRRKTRKKKKKKKSKWQQIFGG